MAPCYRQQVGTVGAIGLKGAIDGRPPVRGAADHGGGEHPPDIPLGDQVLDVVDRRRHLTLQTDRMANATAFRRVAQLLRLGGVSAEWPFAINVFPRLDRCHDRLIVIGHLDADRYQVDIGVPRQLPGVSERERDLVMPRRSFGRFLPGGADGDDFELRQRA